MHEAPWIWDSSQLQSSALWAHFAVAAFCPRRVYFSFSERQCGNVKTLIQGAIHLCMKFYIFIILNANEKPFPSEKINHTLLPKIWVLEMVLSYIKMYFITTLRNFSHFVGLCFWQHTTYISRPTNLLWLLSNIYNHGLSLSRNFKVILKYSYHPVALLLLLLL